MLQIYNIYTTKVKFFVNYFVNLTKKAAGLESEPLNTNQNSKNMKSMQGTKLRMGCQVKV